MAERYWLQLGLTEEIPQYLQLIKVDLSWFMNTLVNVSSNSGMDLRTSVEALEKFSKMNYFVDKSQYLPN